MTKNSPKILYLSALAALTIEATFLTALNWHPTPPPPETLPVEATLLPNTKAMSQKSSAKEVEPERAQFAHANEHAKASNDAGSRSFDHGLPANERAKTSNDARSRSFEECSHGPIATYTPSPVIPDYLKNQDIKASVIIEFLITAKGTVIPRLLSSSGNDELDQLALKTARTWRFQPAQKNNTPTDDKIRLRLNFEVH